MLFSVVSDINGKKVLALKDIEERSKIMSFSGPILKGEELPNPYSSVEDHYVQIGENLYMGPSGKEDDFINHSCNPNAALIIDKNNIYLKAIKKISKREEITWDYSTVIDEYTRADQLKVWTMECYCGNTNCRKVIGGFRSLPEDIKEEYKKNNLFPAYILKKI